MATQEAPIKNHCTFATPKVRAVLDRLYAHAKRVDEPALAVTNPITDAMEGDEKYRVRSEMLAEAYLPVPRAVGRLLYILARAHSCKTIVEFGTSLAISTIYLAAAIRDNGGGTVITTEFHPGKNSTRGRPAARAKICEKLDCSTSWRFAWVTPGKRFERSIVPWTSSSSTVGRNSTCRF
jgi:hypothetical protein